MIEWKAEYSLNIPLIDKEHKKLFEIGQAIYDLAYNKEYIDYYDRIMDLLDELKEYTIYHFADEEKIMRLYDYPDFNNHKSIHDNFIEKLENVNLNRIDDDQQAAVSRLLNFVYEWLIEHILGQDVKIKEYFESLKNNIDFRRMS